MSPDQQLTETLWLGDRMDGFRELTDPFSRMRVLNVAEDCDYQGILRGRPPFGEVCLDARRSYKVGLADGPGNPPALFRAAVLTAKALIWDGSTPLLIHCIGGKSRSPAVMACMLCAFAGCGNLTRALEFIQAKRPEVGIHPELWKLAKEFMERGIW